MISLLYCIVSLFYYVCVVSCPYVIYYPTLMARYSLFVLKVLLNTRQTTNKQSSVAVVLTMWSSLVKSDVCDGMILY